MPKSIDIARWTLVASLYLALGWIAGLVILLLLLGRSTSYVLRLRRALAPTIRCPAGHLNQQWGRFSCPCGAETMSSVWSCPMCRGRFGHVRCSTCQLAIANPLLAS